MPRMIAAIALALAAAVAAGCAITPEETSYYRNEEIRDQIETTNYQLTYDTDANWFYYHEGPLKIRLTVHFDRIYSYSLKMDNQSDQPVVIDWNRVEYVDAGGVAHSMVHRGVPYGSPVSAQRPTMIAPDGFHDDLLRAADRKMVDGQPRLMEPRSTPDADSWGDTTVIVMPIKALGQWRRYRMSVSVGQVSPTAPADPFWD